MDLPLKALVTHPDVATTKKNRDYVIKQVASAVATIAGVAQAVGESQRHSYEEVGYLAKAFHELNVSILLRCDIIIKKTYYKVFYFTSCWSLTNIQF